MSRTNEDVTIVTWMLVTLFNFFWHPPKLSAAGRVNLTWSSSIKSTYPHSPSSLWAKLVLEHVHVNLQKYLYVRGSWDGGHDPKSDQMGIVFLCIHNIFTIAWITHWLLKMPAPQTTCVENQFLLMPWRPINRRADFQGWWNNETMMCLDDLSLVIGVSRVRDR